MIRKSKNESVTEVNPEVNPANPKVNPANPKVNKNNIQSARGFHLRRQMASCVLSTSKRFQYLKTPCPRCFMQGGTTRSEVVRPYRVYSECNDSKLPGMDFQHPSLANLSAHERVAGSGACWKRYKSVNYQTATE
jgi:hypothetical protein